MRPCLNGRTNAKSRLIILLHKEVFNGNSFTDVTEVKSDNDIIIYNVAENLSGYTTTTIDYRIISVAADEKKYIIPVIILQNSSQLFKVQKQ